MKSNFYKTLLKAKDKKDDEWYTTREMAEEFLEPFWDQIQGRKVYCPCDGEQSEIYKLLKERGADVTNSADDYRNHLEEMKNYDIIITNPPFSIIPEFIKDINETGCDFILIRPETTKQIEFKLWKQGRARFVKLKHGEFQNGKSMNVGTITTLKHEARPIKYKKEGVYHVSEGMLVVTRMDFIPANFYGEIALPATAVYFDFSGYDILRTESSIYKHEKRKKHCYFQRIVVQRKQSTVQQN